MVRINYQFEKRKRDLEKKQKQEAKRLRKLAKRNPQPPVTPEPPQSL